MRKQVISAALVFALVLAGCAAAGAEAPGSEPRSAVSSTQVAQPGQTLTREQAAQIALDHAGFTADQVTRLNAEYEIDDGIPQFDIEFYQGDWEYEFEISAEDGRILSFDKDHKYN